MARPRRPIIRDRHVSFRLSAVEHLKLVDKAHRSGLSVGDFVRARVLPARTRRRPAGEAEPVAMPLLSELRRIGVNVNQIAHHCNRHQVPPPAELEPLLAEIRSLLAASWRRAAG